MSHTTTESVVAHIVQHMARNPFDALLLHGVFRVVFLFLLSSRKVKVVLCFQKKECAWPLFFVLRNNNIDNELTGKCNASAYGLGLCGLALEKVRLFRCVISLFLSGATRRS